MKLKRRVKMLEEEVKTLLYLIDKTNQRQELYKNTILEIQKALMVLSNGIADRVRVDKALAACNSELQDAIGMFKEEDTEEVKDWSDPVQVMAVKVSRLQRLVRGREKEIAEMRGMLDLVKVLIFCAGIHRPSLEAVMPYPEKRESIIKEFDAWYEKLTD